MTSSNVGRRTGLDHTQQGVLASLRAVAQQRKDLDQTERVLIRRGLDLSVPVTFMSEALGLGRTTLGMRLRARPWLSRPAGAQGQNEEGAIDGR